MADNLVNESFKITVTQLVPETTAVPGKTELKYSDFIDGIEINKNQDVDCPDGTLLLKGPTITAIPAASSPARWGCMGPGISPYTAQPAVLISMIMVSNCSSVISNDISCFKKGCIATCTCSGTDLGPNSTTYPFTGSCKFEITDAGQVDVDVE